MRDIPQNAMYTCGIDRRSSERYNYRLDVVFQASVRKQPKVFGIGESVNVSSSGILFHTDRALLPGTEMSLAVNWPATFDGVRKLKLVAKGMVVRQEGDLVAVDFEECQFRSRLDDESGS